MDKLSGFLWRQVEKAPLESYADVGGLEQQVQEIKEAVELPLTHPELYEDIGIKPPKVSHGSCSPRCACHAACTTADAHLLHASLSSRWLCMWAAV